MSSQEMPMEASPVAAEPPRPLLIPDPRKVGLAGAGVLAAAFGLFGIWAALAPLSGAVIAPGFVKVDDSRKTIAHLEGGIVKEIRVRDGSKVQQGDVLVVMQDTSIAASVDLLSGQLAAEAAKAARLRAERDGTATVAFPQELAARQSDPRIAEILRGEAHLFNVRRKALEEQLRTLRLQIEEAKREAAGFEEGIEASDRAIRLLREEVTANENLAKENYVSRTRVLALQRDLAQTEARRAEYLGDLAQARQKANELDLRIVNLRTSRVQGAADELEQSRQRNLDLQERIRPSRDAQQRQNVVAPVAGEVVNLRLFTAGGVIAPREPILEIVPENKSLIVEARLGPDDIDEVRMGQAADVRLTPYHMRTTRLLTGKVIYISADRLVDDVTRAPYYAARIRVDPASLEAESHISLYPGMPAEVFVRTRDRTMLNYLLEPITNALRRAGRES
jgi:epimerase transport system membrane fusion protein